jgi:hypothetical protein
MPSRQAGEHDAQKQVARLSNLQRRSYERVMVASMMQAAVVQVIGPRVAELATHITPLPCIQTPRD